MTTESRIVIPKVEFYITNVCNLSCVNCNRFNDYNFAGWQKWSDYEDIYKRWAEKVELKQIVILGGEPLLNPSIVEWITGLNRVFSDVGLQVLTNGTRLNQVAGLYEAMIPKERLRFTNILGISIHNRADTERYLDEVRKFLKGSDVSFYDRNTPRPERHMAFNDADFLFVDETGLKVPMWYQDSFYEAAIHKNASGNLTVYNNDPERAHSECGFHLYKNYHFIRGKLYKCGPAALLPEFDDQHRLDISDEDREILHGYKPLEIDNFDQEGVEFLNNIDQMIPQCKFCPVAKQPENIVAFKKTSGATSSF